MIHHLSIDLETYSEAPIAKTGALRYIADPSFEILLFAYSLDGGEVKVIDMANGETLPSWLQTALISPGYIKHAYNAPFEFGCLSRYFGPLHPSQWRCTTMHGLYCGFPAGLDAVGKAIGLPEDKQKLATGKSLIRYFCIPCRPTKTNGYRARNYPHHDPEKWELFKEYCMQDVVTEMEVEKRMASIATVPDKIQKQWETDLRINMRGVAVDMGLVDGAIRMGECATQEIMAEAVAITGLANPNSVGQLKDWLGKEIGTDEEITGLTKDTVKKLLNREGNSQEVQRMLQIRQELGKTSTKKYNAIRACVCPDGRVHGLLQFYGANRSGRWAGRLVQVQNLPRTYLEPLGFARELVKEQKMDAVKLIYGSVQDTLSQLIRTAFVAAPGNVLIDADFSAIEARVISWLADEKWRLDAFIAGRDIYCETASQMFGVPVEKNGINKHLRSKGKVAELACIAKGEMVLTNQGLVPIEKVTKNHRLWDGAEWVSHDGVVCRGRKEVITYEGLRATRDHIVWAEVEGKYRQVRFGDAASGGSHLCKSGTGGEAIRMAEDHLSGKKIYEGLVSVHGPDEMHRVRKDKLDISREHDAWKDERMPELFSAACCPEVAGQEVYSSETEMREPEGFRLQELRREGNSIRVQECEGSVPVHDPGERPTGQIDGDRQDRREWELCSGKSEMGYTPGELSEPEEVYDILNAGPRNRFTVSNVLVHNCGYQGGPAALVAMGALDMGLTEEELPDIVNRWRTANSHIRDLWYEMNDALIDVIQNGTTRKVKYLTLRREHNHTYGLTYLTIELPSGRKIYYISPSLGENRFGGVSITYMGINQTSKKWQIIETYGGKVVENVTQAIARDCLAEAVDRLEAAGFPIVFHVHDEVVIDVHPYAENEVMLRQVEDLMKQPVAWAPGLPLGAAGWVGDFFTKD